MGSDHKTLTIGETCHVTDGAHSKVKRQESGILYLTSKNIKVGTLSLDKVDYISEADYEKLFSIESKAQRRPKDGDVLIGIIGTFGNAYRYKKDDIFGISSSIAIIRPDAEILDSDFLYYVVTGDVFKAIHSAYKSGSVQGYTNIPTIKELPLPIPPLPEQKAIAYILGSLDDKIELNRQMNETLEAMAQALFKSWFVDFDPVIDNALAAGNAIPDEFIERVEQRRDIEKKVSSDIQNLFPDEFEFTEEMGWIPKGWSVTSLENVCSKITDGSHSSPKSVDEGYPMASVKDMHSWGFDLNTCRKISEEDYHELRRNNCNPLKNDVLIAKDGSYLKHIFVVEEDLDLVVLSSIAMLRPNNNINPHFLSLTLKRKDVLRMMENYVSGAVLQRIVLRDFRKFLIVNPPIDIQTYWFKLVEGMFEASWNNIHSNNSLAKLRDTLLPKLMSGELRIPDSAVILEEF